MDPPEAFLGGVDTQGTLDNPWRLSLMLNGTPTDFEIDTGAEVTAISKERHEKIGSLPLSRSSQTLKGPSDYSLPVTGCFTGLLKRGSQEVQQQIYVVRNLRRQLLGRPAIEALELAVRVGAIFDEGATPVQMFPQLFEGLGKLEGKYAIKLRPDSKPFAISVPRRVAVPLMGKVREELERMERLGVIAKSECMSRTPPLASSRADPGSTRRSSSILEIRRKFRVLANPFVCRVIATDDIPHPIR